MELIQQSKVEPALKFERAQRVGQIRVDITEDRIKGMKAGVFRTIAKDPENQFKFVAHFMTNPSGEYLSYESACEILDEISITELGQVFQQIMDQVNEIAAPKQ